MQNINPYKKIIFIIFMKQKFYTTGQAAKICGISQQTIIRCFDSGRLEGFRIPGSKFRKIPYENLLGFMRENNLPLEDFLNENKANLETVNYRLESKPDALVNVLKTGNVLITPKPIYIKGLDGAKDLLGKLNECREELLNKRYELLPELPDSFKNASEYARNYINSYRSSSKFSESKDILVLGVCSDDAFNVWESRKPNYKYEWDEQILEIQRRIKEVLKGLGAD